MHLNIEFKAKTQQLSQLENKLLQLNPVFVGTDHQTDTYFNAPQGRLKLREGNIENALIHYQRSNVSEAKQSNVILYQHQPSAALKEALTAAMGVKVVVDKIRRIYFVENVKIHFDEVDQLGTFVEVEAIDADGNLTATHLQQQCARFKALFELNSADFVAHSYSDLLMAKKSSKTGT